MKGVVSNGKDRGLMKAGPSGKKMVTGVQVVAAFQVQSIGCKWQAISIVLPIADC